LDVSRLFQGVFELDKGQTSAWISARLSKDELIEKALFEVAFSDGIYLVSSAGLVFRFDLPFFQTDVYYKYIPLLPQNPNFFMGYDAEIV
jgi:hypothetical protein